MRGAHAASIAGEVDRGRLARMHRQEDFIAAMRASSARLASASKVDPVSREVESAAAAARSTAGHVMTISLNGRWITPMSRRSLVRRSTIR